MNYSGLIPSSANALQTMKLLDAMAKIAGMESTANTMSVPTTCDDREQGRRVELAWATNEESLRLERCGPCLSDDFAMKYVTLLIPCSRGRGILKVIWTGVLHSGIARPLGCYRLPRTRA